MYYDLLAKIKNAARARKELIQTSYSGMDLAVAKLLVRAGYLKSAHKKEVGKKQFLEVKVAFKGKEGKDPVLTDFKLVSKPGRRIYSSYQELKPVKQNYGISILSTSKGVMTNHEARKEKVGGEHLCEIW